MDAGRLSRGGFDCVPRDCRWASLHSWAEALVRHSKMKRFALTLTVVGVYAAHQDFWFWRTARER